MDSSNAEKAWDEYASALPGMLRPAEVNALRPHFMAGRASRDAEVAELTRLLAESRARFGDSEARRAELEATVAAIDAIEPEATDTWGTMQFTVEQTHQIGNLLAESRSVVLEDRDREVAARAVESVAHMLETGSTNPAGKYGSLNEGSRSQWFSHGLREATDRVRERAAAIRKGDTNA